MAEENRSKLDQLRHSISVLEGQRATLGDAVVDPALAALRQQIDALEAQAPLDDPEWRRSFLENVPEHRAIVDLWERLTPDRA